MMVLLIGFSNTFTWSQGFKGYCHNNKKEGQIFSVLLRKNNILSVYSINWLLLFSDFILCDGWMIDVAGGEITFALSIYSHEYLCPKRPSFEFPIGEKRRKESRGYCSNMKRDAIAVIPHRRITRSAHISTKEKKSKVFGYISAVVAYFVSSFLPSYSDHIFRSFSPSFTCVYCLLSTTDETKVWIPFHFAAAAATKSPYFLRIFSVLWKVMIMSTFATKSNATHMLQNTEPDIEVMNCS